MCKEMSDYLHPIWHGVFDGMMPGGYDEAEYIFRKWTSPEAIRQSMEERYEYGYILANGERIGLYSYRILDDGRFYINKIYLEPEFRGKGYGKQALTEMFATAKENGCREAFLNVYRYNERAIAVYLKCGMEFWYRCLGRLGNGITRDDWLMRIFL